MIGVVDWNKIEELLEQRKKTKQYMELLKELYDAINFFYRKFECDSLSEDCYWYGRGKLLNSLDCWVHVYDRLIKLTRPEKLLEMLPPCVEYAINLDLNELTLRLRDDIEDYVTVEFTIPVKDETIEELKKLVKEKIEYHLDRLSVAYGKMVLSVLRLFREALTDIDNLMRWVKDLDKEIKMILSEVIKCGEEV